MAIEEYRPNYDKPTRSSAGFPQRDRYKSGQTPVVRIALEEEVSTKIAMIRWMKDQEGESLNSLSSVVEDAVLHVRAMSM